MENKHQILIDTIRSTRTSPAYIGGSNQNFYDNYFSRTQRPNFVKIHKPNELKVDRDTRQNTGILNLS